MASKGDVDPESRRYTCTFGDGSLGIGLSDLCEVVEVDPAGQAAAFDRLRIGHVLTAVGDVDVSTLEEAAHELQHCVRPVMLEFEAKNDGRGVSLGQGACSSTVLEDLANFCNTVYFQQQIEVFCLDNCDHFDDNDEYKMIYTDLHQDFKEIFEQVVARFVESRGMGAVEFLEECQRVNDSNERVSMFFDMVKASFEFEAFVDLMRHQRHKKMTLGDPRFSQQETFRENKTPEAKDQHPRK